MEARRLQDTCWFAARTRYGTETGVKDTLAREGVECFIPTRTVKATRGNRTYERAVIPSLVFLRTTKDRACSMANEGLVHIKYIVDCATRTLLVVPDKQMEDFMRVMDLSKDEGGLMDAPLNLGDRVKVVRGPLRGVEGHVLELRGKIYVVVSLLDSIFAKADVPRAWLEKM